VTACALWHKGSLAVRDRLVEVSPAAPAIFRRQRYLRFAWHAERPVEPLASAEVKVRRARHKRWAQFTNLKFDLHALCRHARRRSGCLRLV